MSDAPNGLEALVQDVPVPRPTVLLPEQIEDMPQVPWQGEPYAKLERVPEIFKPLEVLVIDRLQVDVSAEFATAKAAEELEDGAEEPKVTPGMLRMTQGRVMAGDYLIGLFEVAPAEGVAAVGWVTAYTRASNTNEWGVTDIMDEAEALRRYDASVAKFDG